MRYCIKKQRLYLQLHLHDIVDRYFESIVMCDVFDYDYTEWQCDRDGKTLTKYMKLQLYARGIIASMGIFEKGNFKISLLAILKNNNNIALADKLSKSNIELKNFGNPYYERGMKCPWNSEGLDVQIYTSVDSMSDFSDADKKAIRSGSESLFPEGYVIGKINILPSLENDISVEMPKSTSEELSVLTMDINDAISKNEYALVLDRLHTLSTKYIRDLCKKKGIGTQDASGNNYPLHSLAGSLKKHYSSKGNISDFSINALSCFISLFEKYNNIRNSKSYAHDNEVLSNDESVLVLQTVSAMLNFIEKIEEKSQKSFNW